MADESNQPASAPQDAPQSDADVGGGFRTMGGRQFWGDVQFYRGWRIQQNILTGHYRLLDPKDRRHASGTQEVCTKKLAEVREQRKLPAMSGRAVILIHGIGRSSRSFAGMAKALADEGYTVVAFDYPSTRLPIQKSADYLHSVVQSLEGIDSIDLVCHSMGGLLLRAYLSQHAESRFHRAVMLGVPNNGAELADTFKGNPLFRAVLGPAGQQLVTDRSSLIGQLPAPEFDFGVLAGGRAQEKGYNPLLPGDNDGTVTVASTRLAGAADFLVVPVIHSFLMSDERCVKAVCQFLELGRFNTDRLPEPIPQSEDAENE